MALSVGYALFVDGINGLVDREEVMSKLDAELAKPLVPDRATWGTSSDAMQAFSAFPQAS